MRVVSRCSSRVEAAETSWPVLSSIFFITEARNNAKTTKTQAQVIKQQETRISSSRLLDCTIRHYRQGNHFWFSHHWSRVILIISSSMCLSNAGEAARLSCGGVGEPCGLSGRGRPWNMDQEQIYLILPSLDSRGRELHWWRLCYRPSPPADIIHHCIKTGGSLWEVEQWTQMSLHNDPKRCSSGRRCCRLLEVKINESN